MWLKDEARFRQQGTITDVWGQTRYDWVYLYIAVEPVTGESAALLAPNVNTGTMNAFLKILDVERKPDEHFLFIMDQAGRHKSRAFEAAGADHGAAAAGVLAGTESGGEPLALHPQPLP